MHQVQQIQEKPKFKKLPIIAMSLLLAACGGPSNSSKKQSSTTKEDSSENIGASEIELPSDIIELVLPHNTVQRLELTPFLESLRYEQDQQSYVYHLASLYTEDREEALKLIKEAGLSQEEKDSLIDLSKRLVDLVEKVNSTFSTQALTPPEFEKALEALLKDEGFDERSVYFRGKKFSNRTNLRRLKTLKDVKLSLGKIIIGAKPPTEALKNHQQAETFIKDCRDAFLIKTKEGQPRFYGSLSWAEAEQKLWDIYSRYDFIPEELNDPKIDADLVLSAFRETTPFTVVKGLNDFYLVPEGNELTREHKLDALKRSKMLRTAVIDFSEKFGASPISFEEAEPFLISFAEREAPLDMRGTIMEDLVRHVIKECNADSSETKYVRMVRFTSKELSKAFENENVYWPVTKDGKIQTLRIKESAYQDVKVKQALKVGGYYLESFNTALSAAFRLLDDPITAELSKDLSYEEEACKNLAEKLKPLAESILELLKKYKGVKNIKPQALKNTIYTSLKNAKLIDGDLFVDANRALIISLSKAAQEMLAVTAD